GSLWREVPNGSSPQAAKCAAIYRAAISLPGAPLALPRSALEARYSISAWIPAGEKLEAETGSCAAGERVGESAQRHAPARVATRGRIHTRTCDLVWRRLQAEGAAADGGGVISFPFQVAADYRCGAASTLSSKCLPI
ncbi:MAG TPA: hypothetical protein VGS41_19435, partial [Chthonomonadales bacterium]|nr:hypothetical protein [Chthonomonadales bacterium]